MRKEYSLFALLIATSFCMACGPQITTSQEPGRQVSFQGHKIYYEVHGQGGSTLVFIHGWTGSTETWKYQLDAFPQHRVIVVDLPGNGRSSRRVEDVYSMEFFADAVHHVLEVEEIGQAFFFGHSMGFAVVEVIAARYPQRCCGIGSIDGAHFEVPADEMGQQAWLLEMEHFADMMTEEKGREEFINMLFLPDTPALLKEEVMKVSRTVPLHIGRAMIKGVADNMNYWLPRKVELPCLAVYSPAYGLPPGYSEVFARDFPLVEYHEVEGVSHFFMLEIPYRLNQIITDFVDAHDG